MTDPIEEALTSAIEGVNMTAAALKACDPAVKGVLDLMAGWIQQYDSIHHQRVISDGKTAKALLDLGVPEEIVKVWYMEESEEKTDGLISALMPQLMKMLCPEYHAPPPDVRDVFVEVIGLDDTVSTYEMSPDSTVDQLIASVISFRNIPREQWSKVYLLKTPGVSDDPMSFVPGIMLVTQIQPTWLPLKTVVIEPPRC